MQFKPERLSLVLTVVCIHAQNVWWCLFTCGAHLEVVITCWQHLLDTLMSLFWSDLVTQREFCAAWCHSLKLLILEALLFILFDYTNIIWVIRKRSPLIPELDWPLVYLVKWKLHVSSTLNGIRIVTLDKL